MKNDLERAKEILKGWQEKMERVVTNDKLKAIIDYKQEKISIGKLAEILDVCIDEAIDFIYLSGIQQDEQIILKLKEELK